MVPGASLNESSSTATSDPNRLLNASATSTLDSPPWRAPVVLSVDMEK
jgi:hypothetical protein